MRKLPYLNLVTLALLLPIPAIVAARPSPPLAANPVTVEAGGIVRQVQSPTRVLLDRGTADGVTPTTTFSLHPRRRTADSTAPSLDTNIRLARGKVVSVADRTAVVELSVLTAPVQVGDYAMFVLQAPAAMAGDLLFELALLNIHFRTLDANDPLYTLATLRADAAPAVREALYDALLAEVKAQTVLAKAVLTTRIEGGRFHGQFLHEAFAAATRADVVMFLEFVRAFPSKYIGTTWKFVVFGVRYVPFPLSKGETGNT